MEVDARHQCLIYGGAPSLQLTMLAAMICQKLVDGYKCLYLNSPSMVTGLRSCLAAMGLDVANDVAQSRLRLSSEFIATEDSGFNTELMLRQIEDALDQAIKDGYKGLWASGDMTWEFGCEKNFSKLMEYEFGLEELSTMTFFSHEQREKKSSFEKTSKKFAKRKLMELDQKYNCSPETFRKCKQQMANLIDQISYEKNVTSMEKANKAN